jgi:DNA invertase Pin-like site-specific DNA recombinase
VKVGLYARVSRSDESQNPENQLMRLREYASNRGWAVYEEYVDHISGADANRPELDRLMADARGRRFGIVISTKVDRLGRSVSNLYKLISELERRGVKFECTDQDISLDSATGELLLAILAGVSQFERRLIGDRTKAGIARAKAQGRRLGRPRAKIDMNMVSELRASGKGIRTTAKELGVSHQTLRNRLKKEGVTGPNEDYHMRVGPENVR